MKKQNRNIRPYALSNEKNQLLVIALVISFIGISIGWYGLLNLDVSVFLVYAERLLAGDGLYTDIIDPNLPMMIWLAVPPVLLAEATGMLRATAFFILYYPVLLLILWCTWQTMKPMPWMNTAPERRVAMLTMALTVFLMQGDGDFGQRDPLFALMVMPYSFMLLGRLRDATYKISLQLTTGLLAAIAISLKPHFLLYYVAAEAFAFWVARRWCMPLRLESLCVGGISAIYYLSIILLWPTYFTDVMPQMMMFYEAYFFYFKPLYIIAAITIVALIAFFTLRLFIVRKYPALYIRREEIFFALILLVMLAIAVAQGTAVTYRLQPVKIYAALLLFISLVSLRSWRFVYPAILAIAITLTALSKIITPEFRTHREFVPKAAAVIDRYAAKQYVMSFSNYMPYLFPVMAYSNAYWASGMHSPFIINNLAYPNGIPYHHLPSAMPPLEKHYYEKAINEFLKAKPALVVFRNDVPKDRSAKGRPFHHLSYLLHDTRFKAEWKNYRFAVTIGTLDYYERIAK